MKSDYFEAPVVQTIADDLIELHQKRLQLARIRCLFTTREKKVDGTIVIAWTKKLDPVGQYLSGPPREDDNDNRAMDGADFAIVVDFYRWQHMEESSRVRVIHHELMRMTGLPGKWKLIDGDFEGFYQELTLYGPWHFSLRQMAESLKQQELPLEMAR